jgi:hypothetical protein
LYSGLLPEIGAFANPLFPVDCGTALGLLGVNLILIAPVKLPASSFAFHPA